ncbi:(2Fe-2S)-binding protein [Leucobacter sp. GX24907]
MSAPQSADSSRPDRVTASFGGEPIEAAAGASVAAAIMGSCGTAWRTTKSGKPRGLFCGIGVCYDCIVEIDGQSGQRACMIPLQDGMDVQPAKAAVPHEFPVPGEPGAESESEQAVSSTSSEEEQA